MRNRKLSLIINLFILFILVSPDAFSTQNTEKFKTYLIGMLDVRTGTTVADIGAGDGQLAFMLAEAVGPDGHVYANEIDEEMIERMKEKKKKQQVRNLSVIRGTEMDPKLPRPVDMLFFLHVYHHLSEPEEFMNNCLKYIAPDGYLVLTADDIHDFRKKYPNQEPVEECITDPEETRKELERYGLVFERKEELMLKGSLCYILLFRAAKKESP